jgi:serine/threonine protein kinase
MGEVYRARDSRLNRDVAIKVLRDEIASGDLRSRFEHEARAVAALNRRNISFGFPRLREARRHASPTTNQASRNMQALGRQMASSTFTFKLPREKLIWLS